VRNDAEMVAEIRALKVAVSKLSDKANALVKRSGRDVPAHQSYYALNRAWHALDEADASFGLDRRPKVTDDGGAFS
jgi:hypothetical protein